MPKKDIQVKPKMPRMNTTLLSSPAEPVYTSPAFSATQPAYTIDVTASTYAGHGLIYTLSTPIVDILTQRYMIVRIQNPVASTKNIYLLKVEGYLVNVGTGYVQSNVYRNATIVGSLTSITPRNTNFGFPDNSICTAGYMTNSANPVTGTSIGCVIDSSSTAIMFDIGGSYIFPPNHNLTFVIYNNSNKPITLVTSLLWAEM